MKQIIVFAGPNGSGKSTIISKQSKSKQMPHIYICPDIIVKKFMNIKNEKNRYIQAMIICEKLRKKCIQQKKSFAFETVFSTEGKLKFLQYAKSQGYFIEVVYVTTKDPLINIQRVEQRKKSGGHSVPRDKIINRYYKSMYLLTDIIKTSDSIKVIDNSDSSPIVIFSKYKNCMYLLNKEKRNNDWINKYIVIPFSNDGLSIKDLNVEQTKKYIEQNEH